MQPAYVGSVKAVADPDLELRGGGGGGLPLDPPLESNDWQRIGRELAKIWI